MIALLALLTSISQAAWPEDVTISGMTNHNGLRVVDTGRVADDYHKLMAELGTAISNKPVAPAETLGASGFDFGFSNSFVFLTSENSDGSPSPWERAHGSEDPAQWAFMPALHARKGLPFSFEVGANMSWIGNSRTGAFGGYARLGIVEGFKPIPDLTVSVGYSGYVGNEELELGVMDIGATLGSTYAFGTFPGINQAQFSPYLAFQMLRITSTPLVPGSVATLTGAQAYTGGDSIVLPQFGGGFRINNGTVTMTLAGSYALAGPTREGSTSDAPRRGVPTALLGMGFSY